MCITCPLQTHPISNGMYTMSQDSIDSRFALLLDISISIKTSVFKRCSFKRTKSSKISRLKRPSSVSGLNTRLKIVMSVGIFYCSKPRCKLWYFEWVPNGEKIWAFPFIKSPKETSSFFLVPVIFFQMKNDKC